MKFYEIQHKVNQLASEQPNINTIIESGNIYDLNHLNNIKYNAFCAFCARQEVDRNNEWEKFYFKMYYVDRLLYNQSNRFEIHSAATDFFYNLIKQIEETGIEIDDVYSTEYFNERFNDDCAGAMLNVTLMVPYSEC